MPLKSMLLNLQKLFYPLYHPEPFFAKDAILKNFKIMLIKHASGMIVQPSRMTKAVQDVEEQFTKLKKSLKREFHSIRNVLLVASAPDP